MCSWDLMKKEIVSVVILKVGTVHLSKLDESGY